MAQGRIPGQRHPSRQDAKTAKIAKERIPGLLRSLRRRPLVDLREQALRLSPESTPPCGYWNPSQQGLDDDNGGEEIRTRNCSP